MLTQRLAFEEAGQGTWTGGTDAVPMTKAYELVGIGSEPNKHHPRLWNTRPPIGNSDEGDGDAEAVGYAEGRMGSDNHIKGNMLVAHGMMLRN